MSAALSFVPTDVPERFAGVVRPYAHADVEKLRVIHWKRSKNHANRPPALP